MIDYLDDFAAYQSAKGLAERTITNRDYILRALQKHAGRPLLELTIADLRVRLNRGIQRGSMQTERDAFVAFYRFAKLEGYRTDDPSERLSPIRAPRGLPRPYSVNQIEAMLAAGAYRRTRIMILLAYHQGFRASEVARVHGRDIDRESNTIRVLSKGGAVDTLPLHPAVRAVAETMPRDGWWFPARGTNNKGHINRGSVSDLMRRAKQRAGITGDRLTGHVRQAKVEDDQVRCGRGRHHDRLGAGSGRQHGEKRRRRRTRAQGCR